MNTNDNGAERTLLRLADLGLFADDQATVERLIGLPDGLLLVTGSTGSGKTTTLYACLNFINQQDRKVITVEDPIDYLLAGTTEVQVSEVVGRTFAAALGPMLRQDPSVIMLGEIRDLETASIASNASLTGHLVLSKLHTHTNDAPGAVTRLVDMGVEPFLISSTLTAVLAQRLVRTICKQCRTPFEPTESQLSPLNLSPQDIGDKVFYYGRGCSNCNDTGYRGRKGIFEIFVIDDEARKLIYDKVPSSVLRIRAREMGMRTLREDGARKVVAGLTTAEEVVRATVGDVD
jgi:general secretion pathway protein E/type IV pilus assembly protein PilB